jgi:antitoxin VapB
LEIDMGILIRNPETERKAREYAARRGSTLTSAIDAALEKVLAEEPATPNKRRPTVEEMMAATELFRRQSGLDKIAWTPVSKAEWDALWPTGIPEIDNL